ncbi:hypothetical protein [Frisingicoccus sp.]|uniref:hypothetical protein n=1 Tax=Frisingicoccus sp. TaxID=1918627 RepID=UPI003999B2F7
MMDKNIRRKYFEMQGKLIFPEEKGNNHKQLAATVAANFCSIGYPMTTEQLKKLAKADAKEITDFYKANYEMLSDVLGVGKIQKPFYPDFPEGCMNRDDVDYFVDQIIYGLSGLIIEPGVYMDEKKRFPFIGTPMYRIMMEGSLDDLHKTFELVVKSPIAYSKNQRDFMLEYLKEYPEKVDVVLNNANMKNRENAVTCAMMIEEITGNSMQTKLFMKQPTDLLRYAAYRSTVKENPGRDPYLAIPLRDTANSGSMPRYTIGRRERAFIMDMLADMANGDGEKFSFRIKGHEVEWKRLFKKLHITDKAWAKAKYDAVKRTILIIQKNERLDRPARRIEEAIKNNNLEEALKETKKNPGEFMRRFDKLYRMGIERGKEDEVLRVLQDVAHKAGISTVTGTIGTIQNRSVDEEMRYFKAKSGKIYSTNEKNRKAFTEKQIADVVSAAMSGLAYKFKGKEPMGKVFISDSIKDVKIPADIRNKSAGLGGLTDGSKMPIPGDWEKMRFFVGWTNMKKSNEWDVRVDIDLSVTFCDKNMNRVAFCGWNGSKTSDEYLYSGDVQDGGHWTKDGRAEFVDVDILQLRKSGIKYIIPQVNSYTEQEFSKQPNTTFGVMKRTANDMGAAYEPASVVNRFILDVESTMVVPYLIDIENMEIMWMNSTMNHRDALHSYDDIARSIGFTSSSNTMSLDGLVRANVTANGVLVDTPSGADVIFVRDADEMGEIKESFNIEGDDKFILSSNMEYITGYLMSEN